jgi:hypothetical protein
MHNYLKEDFSVLIGAIPTVILSAFWGEFQEIGKPCELECIINYNAGGTQNTSAGLEVSEIERNRIYLVLIGNRTFMRLYKGWRKK